MSENFLTTALEQMPVQASLGDILKYSGVVKSVLSQLKDSGVVAASWAEVLQITLMVIDLIQQVGPQVEVIVQKVRELLGL